jgi:hypothetical protein
MNSSAGGSLHLSTPKRVDDEEDEQPAREDDEEIAAPEPIEEGNMANPSRNNHQPSDGSYSVDGGEGDDAGGEGRSKPPVMENAIDPATGQPINT